MKRILLFVVDGCTSRVLGPALERGELPALAQLAARGSLNLDCVSIFPSITPAATASIITGRYPAEHGIAGMSWWNPATGEISYFGDDVWTIARRGLDDFLRGFLLHLNGERLQAPTLFQLVERQGLRAACINYLIFRGDVPHEVRMPLLLRVLPISSSVTVHGPSSLCLGDFVSDSAMGRKLDASGGPFNRFGLNDQGTEDFLRSLPSASALPDFTVAYLADVDYESHDRGPHGALDTLTRVDQRLAGILEAWGGIDRALEEACIILTADHSHSDVGDADSASIELDTVLADYKCGDPAKGWRDTDQLLLCPNMRAAEIYLQSDRELLQDVCRTLLQEPRIDQVIWQELDGNSFSVATGDRGTLRFRRAAGETGAMRDEYGNEWQLSGERTALDIHQDGDAIDYGMYPNALERVANGLDHPRSGRIWVTARPGFEFQVTGQSVHGNGGSHGTLHELDSVVPLLVTGQGQRYTGSAPPRIVDVASICAAHLGIRLDP